MTKDSCMTINLYLDLNNNCATRAPKDFYRVELSPLTPNTLIVFDSLVLNYNLQICYEYQQRRIKYLFFIQKENVSNKGIQVDSDRENPSNCFKCS
jgi:hypothetical protein